MARSRGILGASEICAACQAPIHGHAFGPKNRPMHMLCHEAEMEAPEASAAATDFVMPEIPEAELMAKAEEAEAKMAEIRRRMAFAEALSDIKAGAAARQKKGRS